MSQSKMIKKHHINIANILTFSRIILGFIFLSLFSYVQLNQITNLALFIIEIILIVVFIIAIITDGLDGYFARKKSEVTEFGQHFDPLSDSIFFIIVFLSFVLINLMPWYFFIIIAVREGFMHIFLRPYFKNKGTYLPANIYGKIKTIFQSIFSLCILFFLLFKQFMNVFILNKDSIEKYNALFDKYINLTAYIFFSIITFLSIFSLLIYLVHFKKTFSNKK